MNTSALMCYLNECSQSALRTLVLDDVA